MASLEQTFCTQRAVVITPPWRPGCAKAKQWKCQTGIWLKSDFLSYLPMGNPSWKTKREKRTIKQETTQCPSSTTLNFQEQAEAFEYVSTLQYFWSKSKMVAVLSASFLLGTCCRWKRGLQCWQTRFLKKFIRWAAGPLVGINVLIWKAYDTEFKNEFIWEFL